MRYICESNWNTCSSPTRVISAFARNEMETACKQHLLSTESIYLFEQFFRTSSDMGVDEWDDKGIWRGWLLKHVLMYLK